MHHTGPPHVALGAYGLENAASDALSGGVINRVWRIESASQSYVLKQYATADVVQIRQSILVQAACHASGLPVPAVFPTVRGDEVCELAEGVFGVSEHLVGHLYEPGFIPASAARRLGETLGHLHDALATVPAGKAAKLPAPEAIEERLRSLLDIARERRPDPVDAIAESLMEAKLDLLASIERVPEFEPQWTHGDYEWRNVLFDARENVAGVIDFDDSQYFSPARDVMRCIALSFPALQPEVDDYFASYAAVSGLSPEQACNYVEFYRYISTARVWPITNWYQHPERYRPERDALIQPAVAWDWQQRADRLAGTAAEVRAG